MRKKSGNLLSVLRRHSHMGFIGEAAGGGGAVGARHIDPATGRFVALPASKPAVVVVETRQQRRNAQRLASKHPLPVLGGAA
jgi:hypothetical protein